MALFMFPEGALHAQSKFKQYGIDSSAIDGKIQADKARRDSIALAIKTKKHNDSLAREAARIKLQQFRDSVIQARIAKRKADSLAREAIKLAQMQQKKTADSLAAAKRLALQQSLNARKSHSDSLKLVREQKAREKKLLEKYKSGKHYRDSVDLVKKSRTDSLNQIRASKLAAQKTRMQQVKDSTLTARQQYNDSVKAVRKAQSDSTKTALENIKTERQRVNDSIVAVRKQRLDSLTALRKSKEKKTEDNAKTKAEKQKALAIKLHEAKKEEWTNEKLLKRKWTMPRRIYQNTVTRYNYYYNARKKYEDAIRNLKKNNKDDYTKLISLYPYDISKAGGSVAGDMDSVIKKSSFSTQIHDPRSKWFDNLYFLMGKASYVKNDFDGAITTFQFVANEYKDNPLAKKKKTKQSKTDALPADGEVRIATKENRKGLHMLNHHPVRNDALLWLVKSYIQSQQFSEATALISTLEKDKNFPKRLQAELALTKAGLEITQANYEDAIASLEKGLERKMNSLQRARTEFVLAQLLAEAGEYEKSSDHFRKSVSGKANPEMDFYTKLFIAENAAKGGGDKAYALRLLTKVIADSKYEKFRSQAYLVMASIYENSENEKALEALEKSVALADPKTPVQKARAFALMGKILYKDARYEEAKMAYDSASAYGTNPALENLNEINTRKTVLSDVVKNLRIIHRQDSLLALSYKPEKEQKAAAKKEAERMRKEDEEKKQGNADVITLTPSGNVKSNWYFYSQAMMEKGLTEFKQKWGNRKLEDNWRRRAATSGMVTENNGEGEEKEKDPLLINGSQYETLLAEIPKSPQQKDKCQSAIMNAYYDLGLVYFAQLHDYLHSVQCFDTLLERFPKTTLKKQTYYTQYLNYSAMKDTVNAARYKKLLSEEFSQSEFSKLANNPNYLQELKAESNLMNSWYDTTYQFYRDGDYNQALQRIAYGQQHFAEEPIRIKFDLLEGFCLAGTRDFVQSKSSLENFIKKYPGTPEQNKAQELLNLLKSAPGDSVSKNTEGSYSKEITSAKGSGVYVYDSKEEHLVMIFIAPIDGKTLALKSAISSYNDEKHSSEELSTGQNLFTVKEGVITISRFSGAVYARSYLMDLEDEKSLWNGFAKGEVQTCMISTPNFTELLKTRDILGYLEYYQKNYPQ